MREGTVRADREARTGPRHAEEADYDVIVVGGRVAGASTALLLARQGHRVLVVERSPMPSDTVSTHAILRTGVLQLARWGLLDDIAEAGTPPIREVTLGFGDERVVFEVKPDHGVDTFYAPRRYLLDNLLLGKASQAGADIWDRTPMTGLLRDGDGAVTGIQAGRANKVVQVTARFVIGADGHNSKVARLAGSAFRRQHPATNAIHYAYYEGIDAAGFWFQFSPGINTGAIPTNDGLTLVFAGRPKHLHHRFSGNPDSEMARLVGEAAPDLADLAASGTRVSRFHGTTGLTGFIRQAWGPGWSLVGDAGYTKDPISAHGISDALRDAELCARAVDRALSDPATATTALDWYEAQRDSMSSRMFEESRILAGYTWGPEEASARMRVISQEVRDECEVLMSLPDWAAVPGMART